MTVRATDQLTQRHYLVVVLSLLVDQEGHLLEGKFASITQETGALHQRVAFHDWPMLTSQLRQLLERSALDSGEGA